METTDRLQKSPDFTWFQEYRLSFLLQEFTEIVEHLGLHKCWIRNFKLRSRWGETTRSIPCSNGTTPSLFLPIWHYNRMNETLFKVRLLVSGSTRSNCCMKVAHYGSRRPLTFHPPHFFMYTTVYLEGMFVKTGLPLSGFEKQGMKSGGLSVCIETHFEVMKERFPTWMPLTPPAHYYC